MKQLKQAVGLLVVLVQCSLVVLGSGMDGSRPYCDTVVVSSYGLQPMMGGTYEYVGETNGCPSYKDNYCPHYLYYVDLSPLTFWLFGPENGGAKGYIMHLSTAASPDLTNGTWLSLDDSSKIWTSDPNVTITCNSTTLSNVTPLGYWILNFEELTNDSSGHNLTLVAGDVGFESDGVRVNRSLTSFLTLDTSPARSLEVSSDLSITFWIYPESDGSGGVLQWMTTDLTGIASIGFSIVYIGGTTTGSISYFIGDVSQDNPFISTAANGIEVSKWNHVAFTYSGETSRLLMYVNATQVYSGTVSGIPAATAHTNFLIGTVFASSLLPISILSMNSMVGKLAHVGVYDVTLGVLNVAEIMGWGNNVSLVPAQVVQTTAQPASSVVHTSQAVAAITAAPVYIPAPFAYWTLQNPDDGGDLSGNGFDYTVVGLTFDSGPGHPFPGIHANTMYFLMTSTNKLYFPGDMTITFWLYPEATGGILHYSGFDANTLLTTMGLTVIYRNTSLEIVTGDINTLANITYEVPAVITEFEWNHVVLAYAGNTTNLNVYVNGSLVWTRSTPDIPAATDYTIFFAGTWSYNPASPQQESLLGRLACLGLYNETFTQAQVNEQMSSCDGIVVSSSAGICPDACSGSPCSNGGTCTYSGCSGQYTCSCTPGFQGTTCDCPPTFSYNTCYYMVSTSAVAWSAADTFCHTLETNSHLGVIYNDTENAFISSLITGVEQYSIYRTGTNNGLLISDLPLQSLHVLFVDISMSTDTSPHLNITGDSTTTVTVNFAQNAASEIHLAIDNNGVVIETNASLPSAALIIDGRTYTFWLTWYSGNFKVGYGTDVTSNELLSLTDPSYLTTSTYLTNVTISALSSVTTEMIVKTNVCHNGYWTSGESNSTVWTTTNTPITYQATNITGVATNQCLSMQYGGSWSMFSCSFDLCLICQIITNAVV